MQQAERPSRARRAQERTATWLAAQNRETERAEYHSGRERQIGRGRDRESTQELAMPVYLNAGDKSQASLSLSLLAHLPLPLLLRPTTSPLALRVAFMASFKINHSCKSKKTKEKAEAEAKKRRKQSRRLQTKFN